MSISVKHMPDILRAANPDNSISVLRALKHLKEVLEESPEVTDDAFAVAMSDLNQMIKAMANGRDLEVQSI